MMLDNARANVSVYKNSFVAQKEHGCSSELLRRNASNAGIEIKSIPAFQRNVIVSYCEPGLSLLYCLYDVWC